MDWLWASDAIMYMIFSVLHVRGKLLTKWWLIINPTIRNTLYKYLSKVTKFFIQERTLTRLKISSAAICSGPIWLESTIQPYGMKFIIELCPHCNHTIRVMKNINLVPGDSCHSRSGFFASKDVICASNEYKMFTGYWNGLLIYITFTCIYPIICEALYVILDILQTVLVNVNGSIKYFV